MAYGSSITRLPLPHLSRLPPGPQNGQGPDLGSGGISGWVEAGRVRGPAVLSRSIRGAVAFRGGVRRSCDRTAQSVAAAGLARFAYRFLVRVAQPGLDQRWRVRGELAIRSKPHRRAVLGVLVGT